MKKVITFCLWGDNPNYNIGAIKNAELAKKYYPDFECWFYIHTKSVPKTTIDELLKLDNIKIIFKEGNIDSCKPMMWRFEAIDDPDVEIMMSRDTDTRIWEREVEAVNQWLQSDKLFHIMRDHPHHCNNILGGMFGTKKNPSIKSWIELMDSVIQVGKRNYDQNFLAEHIYPIVVSDSLIHASIHRRESHAIPFPTPYNENFNFVGEYVYSDESRNHTNIQQLKKAISIK
jgi:protein O-GlcNAc transferase